MHDPDQVATALERFKSISSIQAARIANMLPDNATGLILYGSRAREDHTIDSDVDLIAVVREPRPSRATEEISMSCYTIEELERGISSIFGAHLARDGKIVFDSGDTVHSALFAMGNVDTSRVISRCKEISCVLSTYESDYGKYGPGLMRLSRFLLRSSLYAKQIAQGTPCFSVREIADRLEDPALAELLSSRAENAVSLIQLRDCVVRLSATIDGLSQHGNNSLEAYIVNDWDPESDAISMALMALSDDAKNSEYAEVRKVLL